MRFRRTRSPASGGGRRLAQARLLRPDWGLGSRMIATQHTVSQIYGEDLNLLLLLGPGCALRLPLALTDLFAEVRNLVGDVGSRFFTAGRCDWQANSYADAHPDQQGTYFAEDVRILLASKRVSGTPHALGRGFIRLAGSAFDVVRQTLTYLIKQIIEAGTEQNAKKKWFSLSGSHVCVSPF